MEKSQRFSENLRKIKSSARYIKIHFTKEKKTMKTSIKLSARTSLADILEQRRVKLSENIDFNDDYIQEVSDPEIREMTRESNMIMKHEISIIDNFLDMLDKGAV